MNGTSVTDGQEVWNGGIGKVCVATGWSGDDRGSLAMACWRAGGTTSASARKEEDAKEGRDENAGSGCDFEWVGGVVH